MWWTKKALLSPQFDQFYTDFLYYPIGARLSFEGLYNSLVGAALWPIFGGVLSFNLLFLSSYVLGALGVYLLVLRLTGDRKAGIVAGVIFVFSPLRNQYILFPNISIIQWIPFLALWFIKMLDEPTIRKGAVTAVFFLLLTNGAS
jgi:asparagine N-glycosylation enzyme membrane subunit Stt3